MTYEFIPINWRYPKFLVHSNIKINLIKKKEPIIDYFVIIKFKEWVGKFPSGTIYNCIGPINKLENKYDVLFYYYPNTPYVNKNYNFTEEFKLQPYNISNVYNTYTIDPFGCKDIDDALSYDSVNNKIGIHIADVNYTINNFKFDYTKYSSIYAPHKTINMLPNELSFNLCSLLENTVKPVISCWLNLNDYTFEFKREFIRISKNFSYDEVNHDLIKNNKSINIIFEHSKLINSKELYVDIVKSSHEMVEVYMIFLNNKVAEILKDKNIIYRNQIPCEYAEYSYENKGHSHMKLSHYTHFTSPIRRIVDLYIHQVLIKDLFDPNLEIIELNINKVNIFERELKKVNLLWNYLKVSNNITNGEMYDLKFIGFNHKSIEFKLLEHNIVINNKLFFNIINNSTILIQSNKYELNKIYNLPLYIIDNTKNQYFPKIIIKFI
jgi:exoribonuclease R